MIRATLKALKSSTKSLRRATMIPITSKRVLFTNTSLIAGFTNLHAPFIARAFSQTADNTPVVKLTSLEQWEQLLGVEDQAYCVDFYADWCGPCKQLLPVLEAKVKGLADGGDGDKHPVVLIKVNVDEFGEIAQALGVSTIPHVFLVRGGEVIDQFVGRVDGQKLDEFFAKA